MEDRLSNLIFATMALEHRGLTRLLCADGSHCGRCFHVNTMVALLHSRFREQRLSEERVFEMMKQAELFYQTGLWHSQTTAWGLLAVRACAFSCQSLRQDQRSTRITSS